MNIQFLYPLQLIIQFLLSLKHSNFDENIARPYSFTSFGCHAIFNFNTYPWQQLIPHLSTYFIVIEQFFSNLIPNIFAFDTLCITIFLVHFSLDLVNP